MNTYIEVYGEEICVEDVLSQLDVDEIMEHYGVECKEANSLTNDEILEYLINEYHRGSFSDFPFNKFFAAVGIK